MIGHEPQEGLGFMELARQEEESQSAETSEPGFLKTIGPVIRHGLAEEFNELLKTLDHAKALKLEARHNELQTKVTDAQKDLILFEEEQLRMHQEEAQK